MNQSSKKFQNEQNERDPEDAESWLAVIGMSCRFPDTNNPREFAKHLSSNRSLISHFDKSKLSDSKNLSYVAAKGAIRNINKFDADLFGISRREAEYMDPQQRILLECAWEAIEDSGYMSDHEAATTGVFVSSSISTYLIRNLLPHFVGSKGPSQDESLIMMGCDKDFLATKISYKLNLTGPSKVIQTACSSSLVAIHDACQSLLNYECDHALAGGISITCPEEHGYYYTPEGINSPDGVCRPFDKNAKGTVIGNGAGIVMIKRLEDAIENKDSIHAVILGSAINNDGSSKVGYTAPSINGQAQVIHSAIESAGIDPASIGFIEAHGTGTILGDPIEFEALKKAHEYHTDKKQYCKIGSVKGNIGHLDAAAGVAGMIKAILSLKLQKIFPTAHYNQPNPQIKLENSPFTIASHLQDWKSDLLPRRAGVSSFGIGGTNAHLILEEHMAVEEIESEVLPLQKYFVPFSAHNETSLRGILQSFSYFLETCDISLGNLSYTLCTGRKRLPAKATFVANSIDHLHELLVAWLQNSQKVDFLTEDSSFCINLDAFINTDVVEWYSLLQQSDQLCSYFRSYNSQFEELTGLKISRLKDTYISSPFSPEGILFSAWVVYGLVGFLEKLGVVISTIAHQSSCSIAAWLVAGAITLEELHSTLYRKEDLGVIFSNISSMIANRPTKYCLTYTNTQKNYTLSELEPSEIIKMISIDSSEELVPLNSEKTSTISLKSIKEYSLKTHNFTVMDLCKYLSDNGCKIAIPFDGSMSCRKVHMPTYHFDRTSYWVHEPKAIVKPNISRGSETLPKSIPEFLIAEWKNATGQDAVSLDSNFFELGGDSLIALDITSAIQERLYVEFSLNHFFDSPRLSEHIDIIHELLAERIDSLTEEQAKEILELMEHR